MGVGGGKGYRPREQQLEVHRNACIMHADAAAAAVPSCGGLCYFRAYVFLCEFFLRAESFKMCFFEEKIVNCVF